MTSNKGVNRKQKWRNTTLNQANIDEYLQDLYNDTSGNYITQGVSFNKDDTYQMTLLRNALIAHGSFSGFIKSLLHSHFEKNGKLDDTIWQPNRIEPIEETEKQDVKVEDERSSSPPPSSPIEETQTNQTTPEYDEKEKEETQTPSSPTPTPTPKKRKTSAVSQKSRLSNFSV